jgi:hypothetical protein
MGMVSAMETTKTIAFDGKRTTNATANALATSVVADIALLMSPPAPDYTT